MFKFERLEMRLSASDKELITRTANKFNLCASEFILAVIVPYCLKLENNAKDKGAEK